MPNGLHIAIVDCRVKPDALAAFAEASRDNAAASLQEPGVIRFDVLQDQDDPTRFVLYEVYRKPEDQVAHRDTAHYQRWRDTVAAMMAEPRSARKLVNAFPDDDAW
jgi:(4S)-4-hydroxy-5-phosphonooxypentane-2,3-dione isomerase